jgi:hypothetical protein
VTTASLASREGGAAASFGPVRSRTPSRSGPPRPRTDRPAGHGKADPSCDPLHAIYGTVAPSWPITADELQGGCPLLPNGSRPALFLALSASLVSTS